MLSTLTFLQITHHLPYAAITCLGHFFQAVNIFVGCRFGNSWRCLQHTTFIEHNRWFSSSCCRWIQWIRSSLILEKKRLVVSSLSAINKWCSHFHDSELLAILLFVYLLLANNWNNYLGRYFSCFPPTPVPKRLVKIVVCRFLWCWTHLMEFLISSLLHYHSGFLELVYSEKTVVEDISGDVPLFYLVIA